MLLGYFLQILTVILNKSYFKNFIIDKDLIIYFCTPKFKIQNNHHHPWDFSEQNERVVWFIGYLKLYIAPIVSRLSKLYTILNYSF